MNMTEIHKGSEGEKKIRQAFGKALDAPSCRECNALLKAKAVFGTDEKGDDFDYEGLCCPNGCRLEVDYID